MTESMDHHVINHGMRGRDNPPVIIKNRAQRARGFPKSGKGFRPAFGFINHSLPPLLHRPLYCTVLFVHTCIINHQLWHITMREITANKFRAALKSCADQSIADHEPLRVTRKPSQNYLHFKRPHPFYTIPCSPCSPMTSKR